MNDAVPTPAVPPEARRVFGVDRLPLAERYVAWLAHAGAVRGLIGPREVPRLWERHVLNCAVVAEVLPAGAAVADIGSGAGLPGLVLAVARPDLEVTLVEPLLRRTTFLAEVAADLELSNVEVVRGRADALQGSRVFDVVTSRAVAALSTLLDWSMPLVAKEGALVAMKGSSAADEVGQAADRLAAWGCDEPEVLILGEDLVSPPTTVVRVAWADPARVSWPPASTSVGPVRRSGKARGRSSRRR